VVSTTIDHLVAVTTFLVAFFIFISLFSQVIQAALLYQFHSHLAIKCSDMLDNILLSFGNMSGVFGLGDYNLEPYTLNPYYVMKLESSETLIEYPLGSGIFYSNITLGLGDYLLIPLQECVTYETAQELLGVRELYGFQLSLTPVIHVTFSNIHESRHSLSFDINVNGIGSSISNANVTCNLFYVSGVDEGTPVITSSTSSSITDQSGKTHFSFQNIDTSKNYVIIATAKVADFHGVGYIYKQTLTSAGNVIPFIENIENGTIILAHSWDVKQYPNSGALHYNATFFVLNEDWELEQVQLLGNYSGVLNYAAGTHGKAYNRTQIPEEYLRVPGILIVTCRKGNEYGVTVMPWQIQTLSFNVTFGGGPSNQEWVATDLRQVLIGGVPYQAKLALWSLKGYQVIKFRG